MTQQRWPSREMLQTARDLCRAQQELAGALDELFTTALGEPPPAPAHNAVLVAGLRRLLAQAAGRA